MSNAFAKPGALGRTAAVALAGLLGALLACRRNGPNQPGTYGAADVNQSDAAPADAAPADAAPSDAGPAPAPMADAAVVGAVAIADGGKACKLGGLTATEGTQVMMFRDAGDFAKLLAAADAGANQQQRTDLFRNGGGILLPFGTPCTVLETLSSVVKVQITSGSWLGTQGWVPGDSVAIQ